MRQSIAYGIERACVTACSLVLGWAPLPLCKAVLFAAADLWRLIERRQRRRAVDNVMRCLKLGRREAELVVRDNYRHFALVALEIARLARIGPDRAAQLIDAVDAAKAAGEAMAAGKGLVILGGHLGNWEWSCIPLARHAAVQGVIARVGAKSFLLSFINRLREKSGVQVWEQRGAMRKAAAALRRGGSFGAIVDEDVGRRGRLSPFFGRPAFTFSQPMQLAVKTGAPLMVAGLMRIRGTMRFRVVAGHTHWPNPKADTEEETARLFQAVNHDLVLQL